MPPNRYTVLFDWTQFPRWGSEAPFMVHAEGANADEAEEAAKQRAWASFAAHMEAQGDAQAYTPDVPAEFWNIYTLHGHVHPATDHIQVI